MRDLGEFEHDAQAIGCPTDEVGAAPGIWSDRYRLLLTSSVGVMPALIMAGDWSPAVMLLCVEYNVRTQPEAVCRDFRIGMANAQIVIHSGCRYPDCAQDEADDAKHDGDFG